MNFFGYSLTVGKVFGIDVRVHFSFFFYLYYRMYGAEDYLFALAVVVGLYFCILLHEFGHSFAARFCGGESDEIILWPFGGLALCRPVFHPTAELITTVAGPLVTLVLWGFFSLLLHVLIEIARQGGWYEPSVLGFVANMAWLNKMLLFFNLIPAFPMDGGRIFLELLWYRLGFERAAMIAVRVSQCIAVFGMVVGFGHIPVGPFQPGTWIGIMSLMVLAESQQQAMAIGAASIVQPFSLKRCFQDRSRRRLFFGQMQERLRMETETGFHRCHVCGRTEVTNPDLVFRVAADGEEYCQDHLPGRRETG